jgi:hypothetical protein
MTNEYTVEEKVEIERDLRKQVERGEAIDLDHLPKVEHNWIKRGIKVSCEGAGHPHHSHFLVKRSR